MIKTGTILFAVIALAACAVAPAFGFLERTSVQLTDDEGHGSGVAIGSRLILTAKHVANHDNLEVVTRDGDKLQATTVWRSEDSDLAIMRTAEDFKSTVSIAHLTCDLPRVGDPVTLIGHPLSIKFAFSFGRIASFVAPVPNTVLMDMTVLPGDSGGPVMNSRGDVIGVAIAVLAAPVMGMPGIRAATGYSLMAPIGDLCRRLPPEVQ